jgi:Raf kinase inhibitor-like YbhB/YbcL family protein
MTVSSPEFEPAQPIPSKFTCDGQNISPRLDVVDIPKKTESLALIMDDPDSPNDTFTHWLAWNIPANTVLIEEGRAPRGSSEGLNDFGARGYGGPCPHAGTHHYHFKLYALDSKLDLPPDATKAALLNEINQHLLAEAKLVGLYSKR